MINLAKELANLKEEVKLSSAKLKELISRKIKEATGYEATCTYNLEYHRLKVVVLNVPDGRRGNVIDSIQILLRGLVKDEVNIKVVVPKSKGKEAVIEEEDDEKETNAGREFLEGVGKGAATIVKAAAWALEETAKAVSKGWKKFNAEENYKEDDE